MTPRPKRKKLCPICKEPVYVRRAIGESEPRLFTEEEAKRIEARLNSLQTISVVGESNYQPDIWKIVGKPKGQSGDSRPEWSGKATLVPEPHNKFDKNAVRVEINHKTVGYLDRELAARFQSSILRQRHLTVLASCIGGFELDSGGRAFVGIELLFDPDEIAET